MYRRSGVDRLPGHGFAFADQWEGRFYEEKEVTVYFKLVDGETILLTVKARYGRNFPRQTE